MNSNVRNVRVLKSMSSLSINALASTNVPHAVHLVGCNSKSLRRFTMILILRCILVGVVVSVAMVALTLAMVWTWGGTWNSPAKNFCEAVLDRPDAVFGDLK
jgi:hypothetical protein